jgi:hypothetical protein
MLWLGLGVSGACDMIGRVENIWTELGEPGKWGVEQEERGEVFLLVLDLGWEGRKSGGWGL